jgi:hypothetical protein
MQAYTLECRTWVDCAIVRVGIAIDVKYVGSKDRT